MRFREALRRSAAACAVVLSFAAAAPAAPQDQGQKILEEFAELLRHGPPTEIVEEAIGAEDFAEMVNGHPAAFRKVCESVTDIRPRFAAMDAAKSRLLTGRLVELATGCLQANPEDPDAMSSLALARLVRGRTERDRKGKPDSADFGEAASLLEKAAAKRPDGGAPAAAAAEALMEGALIPGADAAGFAKRTDDLLDGTLKQHPDSGPVLRVWAVRTADRAAALLPAKKADATALVEAAIKRVAPAAQKAGRDVDVATAYNSLVGFLLDRKLPTKAEFVTESSRCGLLEAKVPVSRRFHVDAEDGSITQLGPSNEPLRTITFATYDWDSTYDFGQKDAPGGDNAKGIATADFASKREKFTETTSAKEVSKGRLNGRIAAYVWEVAGTRKGSSKPERLRSWIFKSEKGNQVTFAVRMSEWDLSEIDAAGKSVLDSMTEIGK